MAIDEGLDTGDMLATQAFPIDSGDTSGIIFEKMLKSGAKLLVETIDLIESDEVVPLPQNHSEATYASKIRVDEAKIDWKNTAESIDLQVRAFHPAPVAYSYLDDIRIKVDFLIDTYLDRCGPGGFGKDEHSPVFEQIWDHISLTACRYLQMRGALPDSPEFASQEVAALLIRKQADYGHENIARFGRIGLMVRMHDKVARLENLHGDISGTPNNESIEDNLLDLIGYSTIGKMWEDRTFMLPLME
mgnify:CR=1 FL=1